MKSKHKLISFSLVIVLLMSAVCSVSAFSPLQNGINQKYKELFYSAHGVAIPTGDEHDYYRYNCIYEYNADGSETSDEATPDYILGHFSFELVSYSFYTEMCGDYVVTVPNIYSPPSTTPSYYLGLYIYSTKDNTIYTLREAWDAQLPRIAEMLNLVGDRIGDVNYDEALNVKDATLIQKQLAGLETIQNDGPRLIFPEEDLIYLSDFNRDGERNIKDATAIQKHIAGIPAD